ncbi:MAG: hypothetical protein J0G30_03235 [Actinomycetales bacterium]|nr:hypothetical protein [Actinomycetales bacterium]
MSAGSAARLEAGVPGMHPPPGPDPVPVVTGRGLGPTPPATGGEITVRTPGSIVVVSDALQLARERLDALASGLASARGDLEVAQRQGPWAHVAGAPAAARRFDGELLAATEELRRATHRAERLRDDLRTALTAYAAAEQEAARAQRALGAGAAWLLGGTGLPLLAVAQAAPWVLLAFALEGVPPAGIPAELGDLLVAHPELVTNPAFVDAVRLVATSSDDATLGALHAPLLASLGLGDDALGLTGVSLGGVALMAAARPFGLFRETPVAVTPLPAPSGPTRPAVGMEERLERVPDAGVIRIERYDAPGQPPRWEVYVPPTVTFSPGAGREPFDMTSNVAGVAGLDAGSIRAVQVAMDDAGIAGSDEVQFTGFSQGGMVAARLAASGDWNAVGLASYGGPTGNIALPEGLAGMAIRNTDDLVPALAGPQTDDHLLQIERRAFAPGDPIPPQAAPAHQREAYLATASAVDQARSGAVREQVARLDAFGRDYLDAGGSVTVFEYETERVGATAAAAGGGAGGSGAGSGAGSGEPGAVSGASSR